MEEKESVFREKSLERVNSPEELDHYLKVTNPSFWLFLIAVIILLLGVLIWGIFGKMEGYVKTGCVISDNEYTCYVDESNYDRLAQDEILRINDTSEYTISIDTLKYETVSLADAYAIKLAEISSDNVFALSGECELSDGYYTGKIITETVSPISFILN